MWNTASRLPGFIRSMWEKGGPYYTDSCRRYMETVAFIAEKELARERHALTYILKLYCDIGARSLNAAMSAPADFRAGRPHAREM